MLILHRYPEEMIQNAEKDELTKMFPESYLQCGKKLDTL